MNIYIGNLAYTLTDNDLKDAFSAFGEVSRVTIIKDKISGQSKGFGFVEMTNDGEAHAAIEGINGTPLNGRNVKVNEAKPREARPPRNNNRR